jgi:hypothetical protein
MDYEKLIIKTEHLGKLLYDNSKQFVLTNDLTNDDKRYIFEMITKSVFIIKAEDAPVKLEQVKMIKVTPEKPKAKGRTKKK